MIPHAFPAQPSTVMPGMSPAYHQVQARQSFGPYVQQPPLVFHPSGQAAASTQSSIPTPEPAKAKVEWPDSVRRYVQRSFLPANHDSTVSRLEVEAKLKEVISRATEGGHLYEIDWDAMVLPQALVQQDRNRDVAMNPAGFTIDTASRKRKSSDMSSDYTPSPTPPWATANTARMSLENRVSQPSPDKGARLSKAQKQLEKRQRRFENSSYTTTRSPTPPPAAGPCVGTSQTLEKRYLRLTAPPVPSQVRPEPILHQTLELLKRKWKKEGNYSYICDQFKSMRQDLTVQRIRNDFTVTVYEIHARIALEKGDLGEYNQCQTQLRSLYGLGLRGNPVEFKAYRILYFIHTANRGGLNDALADLTQAEKEQRPIKHALNVRSALALGNYHKFFQLYLDTPNMGAYLMDMFAVRERLAAMCNICKTYKPDVKLRFITEELGFESDADAWQFIIDHHGQHLLEERGEQIVFLTGKAGVLFEGPKAAAFRRIDIKGQI